MSVPLVADTLVNDESSPIIYHVNPIPTPLHKKHLTKQINIPHDGKINK